MAGVKQQLLKHVICDSCWTFEEKGMGLEVMYPEGLVPVACFEKEGLCPQRRAAGSRGEDRREGCMLQSRDRETGHLQPYSSAEACL